MYIITEYQTTNGRTAVTPAVTKTDPAEAESAYLLTCSSACISAVEVHTVLCMDEHGNPCFGSPKYYEHPHHQA